MALIAALGGSTLYAQEPTEPQKQASTTAEDTFKAMNTEELPQAVKDAVAKEYEGKTIKAAYVNESGEVKMYKVTLSDSEGATTDILFNEKGEILPNK